MRWVNMLDGAVTRFAFAPLARAFEARTGRSPYVLARFFNDGMAVAFVALLAALFRHAADMVAWTMLAGSPFIVACIASNNFTYKHEEAGQKAVARGDTPMFVKGSWTPGTRVVLLLATLAVLSQCLGMPPFGGFDPNRAATWFLFAVFAAHTTSTYFAACGQLPPPMRRLRSVTPDRAAALSG